MLLTYIVIQGGVVKQFSLLVVCKVPVALLTITSRTLLSFPGCTEMILAVGHLVGTRQSSLRRTTSLHF